MPSGNIEINEQQDHKDDRDKSTGMLTLFNPVQVKVMLGTVGKQPEDKKTFKEHPKISLTVFNKHRPAIQGSNWTPISCHLQTFLETG